MALAPSGSEPALYGNPDWVGSEFEKVLCKGWSKRTDKPCPNGAVKGTLWCVGHAKQEHAEDK